MDPNERQVAGDHYKKLKIEPIEYIEKNGLGFSEGAIVKYITRHRDKGGAEDIKKIIHFCEFILKYQYGGSEYWNMQRLADVLPTEFLQFLSDNDIYKEYLNLAAEDFNKRKLPDKLIWGAYRPAKYMDKKMFFKFFKWNRYDIEDKWKVYINEQWKKILEGNND
jgi:hypothetical protein